MSATFSEKEVHEHIYKRGLESLIQDVPTIEDQIGEEQRSSHDSQTLHSDQDFEFELWRVLKMLALTKIVRLHRKLRYGEIIGSKVQLPTDGTRPMELDFIGRYDDGVFIVELKVDRSAERNAFSELFAYSNYIAEMFAMSGRKDIANILVAAMDVKITKQAFLYDLLVADRNIIVYRPEFGDGTLESLKLGLYLPPDEDFQHFTNNLLSHDAISCVVVSFHDVPGWIDSDERDRRLGRSTVMTLEKLSSYAAQLMEAEHLHGFCMIRKPWRQMPRYYRNSLFICAVNPFAVGQGTIVRDLEEQLNNKLSALLEASDNGFQGRLLRIAKRVIVEGLAEDQECELEMPLWSGMISEMQEVVFTHNFGFHPTGILREAYVSYLDRLYVANRAAAGSLADLSRLKVDEIVNWFHAWEFMEKCGFPSVLQLETE